MADAPYMPLYVADYLGDTQHLTAEQHGVYLLLLMTMWRQGGRLPNDPAKLARIARVSLRRWHLVAPDVMDFFEVDGSDVVQKRLEREHQKAISKREKRIAAGARGGAAKSLKNNKPRLANATAMPEHYARATPEPEPDSEDSSLRSESAALLSGAHAPAPAREAITPNRLAEVLHAAAGAAMARTPGAELMTIPLRWLADGMDLEADVLPVIRAKCGRAPPGSINGWAYFTRAVHEAHQTRTTPMEIQADVKPARRSPPRTHAERADDCLRETVAALAEAFGGRSQTPGSTPFAGFDAGGEIVDLEPDPGTDPDDLAIGGRW